VSVSDLHGLYVHVPFCKSKCPYCDFFSVAPGDAMPRFLADLDREVELYLGAGGPFDTLYVGGGTPSLFAPEQLSRLLTAARRLLDASGSPSDPEVTVEMNPADVGGDLLAAMRDAGVNRVSLGVQSFHDDELAFLGRRHRRAGADRAIERIRDAGFDALALDLIYGLPGSSRDRWRETLARALALGPEHLSCYALTVAADTPFGSLLARGELELPDESESAALFLETSETLVAAGYEHYEVSNFAREPGLRSRHNQKYWSRTPTQGLGPAAHSFDGRRRWSNTRSLEQYHRALAGGVKPVEQVEEVDAEMARLERVALGMRTAEGVAIADLLAGKGAEGSIERLLREGYVTESDGRLLPTRRGFLVADGMAKLFC